MSKATTNPKQPEKVASAAPVYRRAAQPYKFKHRDINSPSLIKALRDKGAALATVRGTYADDGTSAYTYVFWPVKAVAIATGRSVQVVKQWALSGAFIPAQRISGRPVFAEADVSKLLETGQFFEQSINDPGHVGDIGDVGANQSREVPETVAKQQKPTLKAKRGLDLLRV